MPRDNANGARAKSGGRTVPVGSELIRLYAGAMISGVSSERCSSAACASKPAHEFGLGDAFGAASSAGTSG